MITDKSVGQLILAQYGRGPDPKWDYNVGQTHPDWQGITWNAKLIDGVWVICFEGSHDAPGWVFDFTFVPVKVDWIPGGGWLHAGFYEGLPATWATIRDRCKPGRFIFGGHSRGASQAVVTTALAVYTGDSPLAYIRWGEPASSMGQELGAYIAKAGIVGRSYRNIKPHGYGTDIDLVTTVPPALLGWKHCQPFTDCWAPPDAETSKWGILACHHFGSATGGGYLSVTPETVIVP